MAKKKKTAADALRNSKRVREEIYPTPQARYDEHNNPYWELMLPVRVTRMDNTMALVQAVGRIESDKKEAEIGVAIGGLTFTLWISDKKSKKGAKRRYGINIEETLRQAFQMDDLLQKAKHYPLRKGE